MPLPRCPRAIRCAGEPISACWTIGEDRVRFLDQARAFLEAAARPVEHRFDLDEAGGKGFFGHV